MRALPLGPPNLKVEREPNNNQKTAHKIELGGKRIGLLTEKSDVDNYRFHLAAKQTVQLDFNGTGKFRIQLYWDKESMILVSYLKNYISKVDNP